MKAWMVDRLGEPSTAMTLGTCASPSPGPADVALDVVCCGLNFADVLMCRGEYQETPDLPFVPGTELVGRLREPCNLPDGTKLEAGRRVLTRAVPPRGALAEHTVAPATTLLTIDDEIDDAVAAATHVTFQTAWFGLHRLARLQPGEHVLIHAAAGGTGSAALQLALAAGGRVIATAGGPEKVAACRRLGAQVAIDYRREDFVARVLEETDGAGADVIFDPVGGDTTDGSRRCIGFEGRLIIVGFASGRFAAIASEHVFVKNYAVLGLHWPLYERRRPDLVADCHQRLSELATSGRIIAPEPDVRPMTAASSALQDLAERQTVGKVVIQVAET